MQTEELLTRQQVAKLLHCSPHFVDQLRQNKGLPHLKLGRSVRFRESEVQEWITKNIITNHEKQSF